MAKRLPWKHVKAKGLSMHSQTLYERYAHAFESADKLGQQLKESVSLEWNNKYPDGIDGQICIFNAIGGTLMYLMKEIAELEENAKKAFDADRGDDVFSRTSAVLTSDPAKVNAGTAEPDTLVIIGESLRHALSESAETDERDSAALPGSPASSFSPRLRRQG
jgi:hypothetical protein